MKIEKIEIIRLAIPFHSGREKKGPEQQDYNAASSRVTKMETLLVAVYSDSGLCGWGEAFGHLINPVTFTAIENAVAPFFINRIFDSATDIATLMKQAEQAFHGFGRTGPVRYALSAIDIALWDLLGKQAEMPLWQLLGSTRNHIGLYPSLVSYDNQPRAVAAQVARVFELGYREIKLHETTREAVAAARETVGSRAQIMVDVNCPWSAEEAFQHAQSWADLNLQWLEEPVWPPEDTLALAHVRKAGIPLSAGENAAGDGDLLHLMASGAVDIVQPSVTKVGGITAMLRVFAQARHHPVKVIPHCFYYGAGMMATAQLVALLPEETRLEVPWLQWAPPLHPFLNFQPEMTLPDAPGIGFIPDARVLKDYRIDFAVCSAAKGEHHV